MSNSPLKFLLASWLLLPGSGCGGPDGPERAAVSGTVTYKGELIQEGIINFVPAEGTTGPTAGGSIADGKFDISEEIGPVVGKHRVSVMGQKLTGRKVDAMPPLKIMWDERLPMVPARFSKNPQLVVEVKSGENEYVLELTSDK